MFRKEVRTSGYVCEECGKASLVLISVASRDLNLSNVLPDKRFPVVGFYDRQGIPGAYILLL